MAVHDALQTSALNIEFWSRSHPADLPRFLTQFEAYPQQLCTYENDLYTWVQHTPALLMPGSITPYVPYADM